MAKNDRFEVFVVQESKQIDERGDTRNFWKEVGVAFENADGSLSLKLHLLPDLVMQVRRSLPRDDAPTQQRPRNTQGRGRR